MTDLHKARESAARFNPIISSSNQADTITQCSQLIDALGHMLATAENPALESIHLLTGAISAALNFEARAHDA